MRQGTKNLIRSDEWADLKADVLEYTKALLDKPIQSQTMEDIFAEVKERKGLAACAQILDNLESDLFSEINAELEELRKKNQ